MSMHVELLEKEEQFLSHCPFLINRDVAGMQ